MIYEVNNTFGGRHTYVIPAGVAAGGEVGKDANDEAGLRQDTLYCYDIRAGSASAALD